MIEKIGCGAAFISALWLYLYEGVTIPWAIIMAGAVSLFAFGVLFLLRKVLER